MPGVCVEASHMHRWHPMPDVTCGPDILNNYTIQLNFHKMIITSLTLQKRTSMFLRSGMWL